MNGTMNTTQYDIMKSCDIVSMTVHYLVLADVGTEQITQTNQNQS